MNRASFTSIYVLTFASILGCSAETIDEQPTPEDQAHAEEEGVLGDSTPKSGPHWGAFTSSGCTSNGYRQFSAILWDIPWGNSWESTCADMKADVARTHFDTPSRCVNTGLNMWGEFDVRDASCDAPFWPNDPQPGEESDTVVGRVPESRFSVILASDPQLHWNFLPSPSRSGVSDDEIDATGHNHVGAMNRLAFGYDLPPGSSRPEAVVINGDLTEFARWFNYDAYEEIYGRLMMPRFEGLGNHDYGANVVGDCWCVGSWEGQPHFCNPAWNGPNYCALEMVDRMRSRIAADPRLDSTDTDSMAYSFVRHNVRFIQLHNYPTYEESAIGITNSLTWLRQQLVLAATRNERVILNMHIALSVMIDDSGPTPTFNGLNNKDLFADTIRGYEDRILAIWGGHRHYDNVYGTWNSLNINGTSIPLIHGGSQEMNTFVHAQFNLDGVVYTLIDSHDGTARAGTQRFVPYTF